MVNHNVKKLVGGAMILISLVLLKHGHIDVFAIW